MIRHYCDACGAEVDGDSGVIGMKELTVEMDETKVSIAVEVNTMTRDDGRDVDHPAVCASCIARRLTQWAVDANPDAPVAQSESEQRISTPQAEGSNPSGGAN